MFRNERVSYNHDCQWQLILIGLEAINVYWLRGSVKGSIVGIF